MLDHDMDFEEEPLFKHRNHKIYEESKEETKYFDSSDNYFSFPSKKEDYLEWGMLLDPPWTRSTPSFLSNFKNSETESMKKFNVFWEKEYSWNPISLFSNTQLRKDACYSDTNFLKTHKTLHFDHTKHLEDFEESETKIGVRCEEVPRSSGIIKERNENNK